MIRAMCYCAKEYPQYTIENIGNFTYSRMNTLLEMVGYIRDPSKMKKEETPKIKNKKDLFQYFQEKY